MSELIIKGQKAKEASYVLMNATTTKKNNALLKMAEILLKSSKEILEANKKDLENAIEKGTPKAMLDRLALDESRIQGMADGLKDVVSLPDPIGEVTRMWKRPNGLQIGKQRVPLGVIGIIYEARPNVTCDAAGLCLKSGNVVILRGGKEAINSNIAIVKALREGVKEAGLLEDVIQLVENTDREVATEMMRLNQYIDVLIPRGGAGLIQSVVQNATVPVIETGTGNCHVYVDCDADLEMAKNIVINAKTSRPSVCNAEEKLLVNEKIAKEFLPMMFEALKEKEVEVRGDKKVLITPISAEDLADIKIGDIVWLDGDLMTCRDVAHRRLVEYGRELPYDIRNKAIFHAGPIVRKIEGTEDDYEMVSVGPTTSMRMEKFEYEFTKLTGVRVIVGKGGMGPNTERACKEFGAIHCVFPAGCAVVAATEVEKIVEHHWDELGMPETLWCNKVKEFGPLIVSIDAQGRNLFEENKVVFNERKEAAKQAIYPEVKFIK